MLDTKSWFFIKATVASLVTVGAFMWFTHNYAVGFDIQKGSYSINHRIVLIDKHDATVKRGGYMAFKAARMIAPFVDGQTVVKVVSGLPGDKIQLSSDGLFINGEFKGAPLPFLESKQTGEKVYVKDFTGQVPDGHYFVTGTNPRSYDSRYWGFVEPERIIGKAHGLL